MRSSTGFLVFLGIAGTLSAAAVVRARVERARRTPELEAMAGLVRGLGLTDLCLFTEARYTRHPSQADRFSPFQELPGAPDHFPSGSIAAPPPGPDRRAP